MADTVTEAKLAEERMAAGRAGNASPGSRPTSPASWTSAIARLGAYDCATIVLIAALVVIALCTFKDYAISNDEGVQHHYGELIIAYYTSGFRDQSLFSFENLYLYGGLFDIIAVALSHLVPIDPYDLRHILCALIGIGGIGATAATARLIAGPRAGLIAAIALSVCGAWYGSMFNHTKDIPFATAMIGATLFLIRMARRLPTPRAGDIAAFGLLAGAALGMRVLGLLLVIYAGFAIALYLPRPWFGHGRARWRFAIGSSLRLLPALLLAYVIMIAAWPWAALAPLNPIRGLLAFSEFHYAIRTMLAGQVYEMADMPRLYVPIYILIRMPLLMLFGAALAIIFSAVAASGRRLGATAAQGHRAGRADGDLSGGLPGDLARPRLYRNASFPVRDSGAGGARRNRSRHGRNGACDRGRAIAAGALAVVTAGFVMDAVTLVRLHPYEYLFYNPLVGGLEGASRRYDLDYWFASMPEALRQLEAYLRRTAPADA